MSALFPRQPRSFAFCQEFHSFDFLGFRQSFIDSTCKHSKRAHLPNGSIHLQSQRGFALKLNCAIVVKIKFVDSQLKQNEIVLGKIAKIYRMYCPFRVQELSGDLGVTHKLASHCSLVPKNQFTDPFLSLAVKSRQVYLRAICSHQLIFEITVKPNSQFMVELRFSKPVIVVISRVS